MREPSLLDIFNEKRRIVLWKALKIEAVRNLQARQKARERLETKIAYAIVCTVFHNDNLLDTLHFGCGFCEGFNVTSGDEACNGIS